MPAPSRSSRDTRAGRVTLPAAVIFGVSAATAAIFAAGLARTAGSLTSFSVIPGLGGLLSSRSSSTPPASSHAIRGRRAGRADVDSDSLVTRHGIQTLERTTQSEYRLKIGHAIDVLRTDVAALFDREPHSPDLSIFSDDVVIADARVPSFRLSGKSNLQRLLSTLRWSVAASCESSKLEITSLQQPVTNELFMRWRLKLRPKDVFATAKDLLQPALGPELSRAFDAARSSSGTDMPVIIEGYTRYEFDAWSADIVRLTIEITNPPAYITDLLKNRMAAATPRWGWAPAGGGVGVPHLGVSHVDPKAPSSVASAPAALEAPVFRSSPPDVTMPSAHVFAGGLSLPKSCEDDFECNDGRANFPLQCCEIPLLGNFCCEPEDYEPSPQGPAYVPLPVPVDDPRF